MPTVRPHSINGILGFGFPSAAHASRGMSPDSSINMDLKIPARPAAASKWPTFAFTEPTNKGFSGDVLNALWIACVSIKSPTYKSTTSFSITLQQIWRVRRKDVQARNGKGYTVFQEESKKRNMETRTCVPVPCASK